MIKLCKNCGNSFKAKTSKKTCENCPVPHKICPKCGFEKSHGSKTCRTCDDATKSGRAKENGYGKWMTGRKIPRTIVDKQQAGCKMTKLLQRDTSKTQVENFMRKMSNRKFFKENPRSIDPDSRDKHNNDWRYREWRTAVFVRDDYTCKICKVRGGELQAHHIYEWAKHPDMRYVIDNGMTVCAYSCHSAAAKLSKEKAFEVINVSDPKG